MEGVRFSLMMSLGFIGVVCVVYALIDAWHRDGDDEQ